MTTSHRQPERHLAQPPEAQPPETAPIAGAPTEEDLADLAQTLDPVAFVPLPDGANLGQVWSQIDRQMTARQHAARALTAGYQPPGGRPAGTGHRRRPTLGEQHHEPARDQERTP